jgi:hypothetical protein
MGPNQLPPRPGRPIPARPLPPRPLPARPAGTRPATPVPPQPRVPRSRPDPTGLRVALGFAGVAAASAMGTAFLAPVTAATPTSTTIVEAAVPVQHVTRYVQLLPGQTAPPQATVTQAPAPTPRIVTITTRQSGAKP